ncbi:hypothetical protein [Reticulibacter mediterranei]|uniref:hypothetical protein n=1 Tax=Reticulibacter mediterranei TaxID=2778369 RepID=UPI001C68D528|nr:hypothetical protein [Reticulibacter mediterranei]
MSNTHMRAKFVAGVAGLCAIVVTLALISGHLFVPPSQAALHIQPHTALQTANSLTPHTSPTASHHASSNSSQEKLRDMLSTLHYLHGPDGWAWNTSLSAHRLLAFYGNPLSDVMGPIGQYGDNQLMAKLQEQAAAYAQLDPTHPVIPALDYVTPVVQPVPMKDNSWVYRMPRASVEHYIQLANDHHALFFFDMQVGHSTVQKEVDLVWDYLQRPGVDLSLDPEFDMPPGAIPDEVFGRMTATEINGVIDRLSTLVQTHHLPPKILIIHQFRLDMLPDWQKIHLKPGVQIVTCVDGFGTPGEKIDDYRIFDKQQLIQYPGMKLFYRLDKPLMPPSAVLALDPPPMLVMYQ